MNAVIFESDWYATHTPLNENWITKGGIQLEDSCFTLPTILRADNDRFIRFPSREQSQTLIYDKLIRIRKGGALNESRAHDELAADAV